MAGKKEFRITTPRGSVFTVTGKNGSTTARLEWAPGFAQKKRRDFQGRRHLWIPSVYAT